MLAVKTAVRCLIARLYARILCQSSFGWEFVWGTAAFDLAHGKKACGLCYVNRAILVLVECAGQRRTVTYQRRLLLVKWG
jgi:hypothetical protein